MKKLAEELRDISTNKSEEKVTAFEKRIEGHCEFNMLKKCLEEAIKGKMDIKLGNGVLPPASFWEEGFSLRKGLCDTNRLCWY